MKLSDVNGRVTLLSVDDNAHSFITKFYPSNNKGAHYDLIPITSKVLDLLKENPQTLGMMSVRIQRPRMQVHRVLRFLEIKEKVCRVVVGKINWFVLKEDFEKWGKKTT